MPAARIFILLLTSYLLLVTSIFAQDVGATPTPSPTPTPTPSSKILEQDEGGGQSVSAENYKAPQHADYTAINLEHSAFCELVGMSPVDKCIGLKKQGDTVSLFLYHKVPGGGALGGLTSVAVAMYSTPPASTLQYLASIGENLGIKPVYADVGGSGEGIIRPVLALWQVMRNVAYLGFILVFLAVGIMVMFRTRINPQVVISAQQALPGLAIGLILVTFSYFLASLMIDVAFVGVQLVGQIFIASGTNNALGNVQNLANNSNAFDLFWSSTRLRENIGDVTGGLFSTISSVFSGIPVIGAGGGGGATVLIPAIIGAVVGTILFPGAGALLGIGGAAAGGAAGALATGIVSVLVSLVLIIALLIQFFRLLWQLISSYISLLVATITGPLIIAFASIPGRGGALGIWWRSLLGNALVFPAVFAAFLFAGVILDLPTETFGIAAPPLFGGLSVELLRLILAYGIILGTPAIPGMVRRAMGVPELGGIPQAAIGGFAAGAGVARAGYGGLTGQIAREAEEAFTQQARAAVSVPPVAAPNIRWWHRLPGLTRR